MKRICKYCGAEYSGDPGSTACPGCVAKNRINVIRDRICRACGVTFPGGPRAWYCPDCRAERRRETDRKNKQAAKLGATRKIGSTDLCVVCGKPYIVASGLQKYCPTCAPEAVKAIDRLQSIAWNRQNTTAAGRREERQSYTAAIHCRTCGKSFVPDTPGYACSKECQIAYAKAQMAKWERQNREYRNQYRRERYRKKKEDNKNDD